MTAGSDVVHLLPTNRLSGADVGKLLLLFGAGAPTTPTNHQDLVARIVSVAESTNVTISARAGVTADQLPATCGTQNAGAFQQCIAACSGTNTIVQVPAGRYLLVPPAILDPAFVMAGASDARPAVVLQTGGIHFLGDDRSMTVLLGCGAWLLKPDWVHRGWMFECLGPITNNTPLVFENLTFDGGVQQGRQAFYNGGPARTNDGAGWDITHDAVVDAGGPPLHAVKQFINCTFTRWRGEMIKSVVSITDGYVEVTHCAFLDGEASGFNFNFTHRITGCTFSNLDMAMEFYAGYMLHPSVFEGSTVENVHNAIVLVGALTNHAMPAYTISNNILGFANLGVLLGPARNVTIAGNQFVGGNIGIGTDDYGYQGTGGSSNILIRANLFQNTGTPFNVAGSGQDRIDDVLVVSNQAWNCGRFADGYGWSSNVFFLDNASTGASRAGVLHSSQLGGQWFVDDLSNEFPWFPVYDGSPATNWITYANGMRQCVSSGRTNAVFVIDDTHGAHLPPSARLIISNGGGFQALLVSSTTGTGSPPVPLVAGNVAWCVWTNNAWSLSVNPAPPQDLRIESHP